MDMYKINKLQDICREALGTGTLIDLHEEQRGEKVQILTIVN